ncbi:hypothetical protein V8G54_014903 [Vigna mungo]|uniref:Reverse transcriptase Ty1/copia-type domain-containing protein n=1 Tax=Vigna mungo TaxID=3915 RepID=A0AAQ3NLG1_VIGMU
MYLRQTKYIKYILKKFNMETVYACPTSMVSGRLFTTKGEPMTNATLYRKAIGALQYLTNTRSYIVFAANKLNQFMSTPTMDYWLGIKTILRYLQGIMNLCFHIKPSNDLDIMGYSDADWVTCTNDRKFMTGQCLFLGETLIYGLQENKR